MDDFKGKRAIDEYTGKINSSPSEIFPLLCPVREYDWLEGWACSMTYSDSGLVEDNCIFRSEFVTGMDATWVAIRRDEENYVFEYMIFFDSFSHSQKVMCDEQIARVNDMPFHPLTSLLTPQSQP